MSMSCLRGSQECGLPAPRLPAAGVAPGLAFVPARQRGRVVFAEWVGCWVEAARVVC